MSRKCNWYAHLEVPLAWFENLCTSGKLVEDLEVTGMRVKREPCPKERGAPVVVGKALKLARRMRISILRDGFLFLFTVTDSPGVGRFAADEVGGDDNVDEQEHCEWGILLEEASWKNPCFIFILQQCQTLL